MVDGRALREAIINAIVHNDYTREVPPLFEIFSDRIVITSYGGLVSGLSREEFFKGCSMIRNRELMRVFKDLELVEQLGSGMRRILEVYDASIFEFTDNFMFVNFPFSNGFAMPDVMDNGAYGGNGGINGGNQKAVIAMITKDPKITITAISKETNIPLRTVERVISELKNDGVIVRIGSRKGGYWEVL
jgi:predicted HTH transcriptional regulator